MNLIANAADAVSEGGLLTIRTGIETLDSADLVQMRFGQDMPPGEYAFLDVQDDGVGMDEATMRRLFKPFFTTIRSMKLRGGATTDVDVLADAARAVLTKIDLTRPVRLLGVRVDLER